MIKNLTLWLMVLSSFAACKKEEDEISLKGKWVAESIIENEYVDSLLTDTYTEPANVTTFDFQNDGTLVIAYPGLPGETLEYTIKPNAKVEIDGDLFDIRALTRSNVTLYGREDYEPGEYDEVLINLR